MEIIIAMIAFIIAIGVLVSVHEFGHFIVAKKLGVKVLRFSIGFGTKIKSWQRGETEYSICALPLGGFVKMLDENETQVDESEKHRAFNRQSVYKRIAIVAAGPLANFLFAIFAYTLIFVIGTTGVKPIIASVEPNSIAQQAGFTAGDQLLSVNNQQTPTIGEFSANFIASSTQQEQQVEVLSKNNDLKTLTLTTTDDLLQNPNQGLEKYLGFRFAMPELEAVIDSVADGSAAQKAGILSGDRIIKANEIQIDHWSDFVGVIKNSNGVSIPVLIKRNEKTLMLELTPKEINGSVKAGVSVYVPENFLDEWQVIVKKDFFDAFYSANQKVWQLSALNLVMIKKMLLGEASVDQISGPISIANYAGKTATMGLVAFLSFLALISIGLGLINLLPIPVLDGGHLLFYFIEIIKGSPINQNTQQIFLKIGLMLILMLTGIAMYNDLS